MLNFFLSWLPILVIQRADVDRMLGSQHNLEVENFVCRVVVEFLETNNFVSLVKAWNNKPGIAHLLDCFISESLNFVSHVIAIERVSD
jgi:hypothetical protein